MAIDTINEKLSLISLGQSWNVPMPISDDGIGQDDKQHLLAGYPGILWSEPAPSVPDDEAAIRIRSAGLIDDRWFMLITGQK